jgi:hypothetical protein
LIEVDETAAIPVSVALDYSILHGGDGHGH